MSEEKEGKIIAKKCEHCDHHEIGLLVMNTDKVEYIPLKPGMQIKLVLIEKVKTKG